MNRKKLLSYGYLFKELPPPFNSLLLGERINSVDIKKFNHNRCIDFSIPKGQYSRRLLQLPHPTNYIQIVNHLCEPENSDILEKHFSKSSISHSKVKENDKAGERVLNKDNRAIRTNYEKLGDSKEKTIIESFDMLYELKIDIAKFYPSIYTHSIVWAILGKNRAKELWKLKNKKKDEQDFHLYQFADDLDKYVRYGQENQSIGIPIGPDTSHIIAEIIGTYFDIRLEKEFANLKAFRYFDDYHIYVETEEEAQKVSKFIQHKLADFQLALNESKFRINKFPFEFQDSWVKEISDVRFKTSSSSNIKQYYNTLFGLAAKHPDKSSTIFSYGLRTFEKRTTEINEKQWVVFESLLLKSVLIEPSILEITSRLFETYKDFISKDKIETTLVKLLKYHSELNHHYETVWSLWIFKQLEIELPYDLVESIINSNDNFSILLLLDLESHNLIKGEGLTKELKQLITDNIEQEHFVDWLLYYEAVEIKSWVKSKKRNDFEPFKEAGISFYDEKAKIQVYKKNEKSNQ